MGDTGYLGVDIGGTGIKGMRLGPGGQVGRRASRPTPLGQGAEAVLRAVREVVDELLAEGPVASVGAGTPGAVGPTGIVVAEAVNIPGWKGTDLRAALESFAKAPAAVRNDANLAGYAEWVVRQAGPGPVSRNLLFVGLGTGIGGGYVEDGRILGGTDDKAVELGHVVIRPRGRLCGCGRRGCVESYASGPNIAGLARDLAPGFEPAASPLAALARDPASILTAKEVYGAFAAKDPLAQAVHREVVDALALGIGAGLALLAPDTVVLGGGVLAGAPSLVADVASLCPEYVYTAAVADVRFETARLGAEAGLLGAAFYGAAQVLDRAALVALGRALAAGAKGY